MESFNEECDRVSRIADPAGFDAAEWAKGAGRMLAEAVELTKAAFAERVDLAIEDAQAEDNRARLTLSTNKDRGSAPMVDINFNVSGGSVVIWATPAEGSRLTVLGNKHHHRDQRPADAAWIHSVLAEIMASLN